MSDLFDPTDEHRALREMVRSFTLREVEAQAAAHDREERFNLPLFRKLGELGLLGLTVEEHGGAGMDAAAAVIAHEELAAVDPGFTLSYLAHALLFANNLAHQRQRGAALPKYLPPTPAAGELIGGMCMSEPGAGTDVLGMRTQARRDGDTYVLNGAKMWITNGAISDTELGDVFLVYARTRAGRNKALDVHRREGLARASRSARRSKTSWACARRPRPSSSSRTAWCRPRTSSAARATPPCT
jgi:isovaleryl-CoA dehydrogenase